MGWASDRSIARAWRELSINLAQNVVAPMLSKAAIFGLPLSEELEERRNGQRIRVQYFASWRFEQYPDGAAQLAGLSIDALSARQCPRP